MGLCTFLCKYAGLFFLQHKCGEILGLTYSFVTMSILRQLSVCSRCTAWREHRGWKCCHSTDYQLDWGSYCTSLLLWSVSTECGYGSLNLVYSLHSWFETLKRFLSLNHPIRKLFYWWCQFSQELCLLIKGIIFGATALNVERTFITYFENNLCFFVF